MRRLLLALLILLLAGTAVVVVAINRANAWLNAPLAGLASEMMYEVPRGASLTSVSRDLQQRGLLEHPRLLVGWARLNDLATGIKAGEYQLKPGLTPRSLLDLFNSGEVVLHSITFVEGSTFSEIRRLLAAHPAIEKVAGPLSPGEIMGRLGNATLHPEGRFFPDTYRFPRGTSDLDVLSMAYQRMSSELDAAWARRADDLPLADPYEALILASIIEKETALESERPMIGGVFVERLRRGMRLQTDPTVIYGLQEAFDGNLRRRDLQADNPYNTYTRAGLPPTPICLPGAESLRAAVRPEITGALFFVATGKGDGSHYFSRTLVEHNAAVQRYLRALRAKP